MIENVLNGIVQTLNNNEGVTLDKGDRAWQNLTLDEYDFQSKSFGSYLDAPLTWTVNSVNGTVNNVYNVSMLLFAKSELEWSWIEHQVVLDQLRNISNQFCVLVANDSNFNNTNFNNNFRALEAINLFDVNIDGIYLTFQVRTLNLPIC
jgi:hypothetical protein